jgi:hypothetical protein
MGRAIMAMWEGKYDDDDVLHYCLFASSHLT